MNKLPTEALLKLIPAGESPKLYFDLVKTQVMGVDKSGTPRPDEDLHLFLYVCKQTGLNPLTKQIYAIYRWDSRLGREKMTIQSSIDGLRLVAQKTGEYAGSDDAIFDTETEVHPNKATITVYKLNKITGGRMPITATARWNEYVQKDRDGKPLKMWESMPYNQLSKCAESLALRKAFPNEMSGVYTEDEMSSSSNPITSLPAPVKKEVVKTAQPSQMPDVSSLRAALKETK